MLGLGAGLYAAGVAGGVVLYSRNNSTSSPTSCCSAVSVSERRRSYDDGAGSYDDEIGMDELVMGVKLMRRWHLAKASGATLEVAAGTGRNLPYYDFTAVTSLTAVDTSRPMLQVAAPKVVAGSPVELRVADANNLSFPDDSFDTVVDTFGLCSFEVLVRTAAVFKNAIITRIYLQHTRDVHRTRWRHCERCNGCASLVGSCCSWSMVVLRGRGSTASWTATPRSTQSVGAASGTR
jgi:hypothetical protein